MKRRTKIISGVAVAATCVALTGTGMAVAGGGDDDGGDTPISGAALDKATAAALDSTGEGHVTGTEVNDEESKYEVEVTLNDGSQVDVQLDEQFNVVSSENDGHDDGGASED
ncbi:MAG TPA: hypothetical protein VGJ86_16315 [Acidimicrobiales bacterium]|jgi:hypothetical protein